MIDWQPIETAPLDGSEILICAQGMAVQARFAPGEWHNTFEGSEYEGAVWVAFDDAMQFEIEEGAGPDRTNFHGSVTHWSPLNLPLTPTSD